MICILAGIPPVSGIKNLHEYNYNLPHPLLARIFQDSEGETTKEKPATKTTVPIDFLASAFADESSQGEAKGKDALSASEPAPARQGTFDLLEGVFGKTDDNTTAPPVSARQT
eukprot:1394711-Amorphochlora_amoeboformis.AAC.1